MTAENIYIILAVLVLFMIVMMLVVGSRLKKDKTLSPLAGLAFACIVAGIFFGNRPIIGFGLLAVGVILAVGDIIIKAGRGRAR